MTQEQILQAVFAQQSDAVQQVIKRTCIVDYGVIVKVLGDNVVRVGISVANNVEDVQIITCTLVSLCSSALSVNIEAVEGDKVLVVFPRHYNPKMFDPEVTDPIIDDTVQGYTRYAGLAFLVNQFDYNSYKKSINISADGVLSVRLPYDENNHANVVTAQTDSEGKISLDIAKDSDKEDSDLVTLTVDQEGNADLTLQQGDVSVIKASSAGTLEYGVGDTNKITFDLSDQEDNKITISDSNSASIETSSDGMTITDKNGCTYETSSEGTVINGNLKVKI